MKTTTRIVMMYFVLLKLTYYRIPSLDSFAELYAFLILIITSSIRNVCHAIFACFISLRALLKDFSGSAVSFLAFLRLK